MKEKLKTNHLFFNVGSNYFVFKSYVGIINQGDADLLSIKLHFDEISLPMKRITSV